MLKKGVLIISLDFELNWGVHDVLPLDEYKDNLLGAREAIPRLLEMFGHYGIHATWGTVGLLFFSSKVDMFRSLPSLKPTYHTSKYSAYYKIDSVGEDEQKDPFHFALTLINQIAETPYQEVGTHTFSHYYCLEEGQTEEQFDADIKAAVEVADKNGIEIKSIVFPRNQANKNYLTICKNHGIIAYRGNEKSLIYDPGPYRSYMSPFKRLIRITDSYLNFTGHHIYKRSITDNGHPINFPSSRFLRPYSPKLKRLEGVRLNRIKKSMTKAAKENKIYHIWWHPHNFGLHLEENLRFLKEILEHYVQLKQKYGMSSLNMAEAGEVCISNRPAN